MSGHHPWPPPSRRVKECLVCGHYLPLAVWQGDVGVCKACRDLGSVNRGVCSEERGCSCVDLAVKNIVATLSSRAELEMEETP